MDNFIIFLMIICMPAGPFALAIGMSLVYNRYPAFAAWHDKWIGPE